MSTLADAAGSGDLISLTRQLERGAPIDALDQYGFTPLFTAVHHGHANIVAALIEAGADLGARVGDESLLHRACKYGAFARRGGKRLSDAQRLPYLHIVQQLLASGADVHNAAGTGATPLEVACEYASAAIVEALLKAGADPARNGTHRPLPLAAASRSNRERDAKVRALLDAGADASSAGALSTAVEHSYEGISELVKLLLDRGADPDAADEAGWTPLHQAVAAENLEMVEFLLSRGARVGAEIRYDSHDAGLRAGMTALDIARSFELDDFVELLGTSVAPSAAPLPLTPDNLVGRWTLATIEFGMSEGGEMPADESEEFAGGYLEFEADGTLRGEHFERFTGRWTIADGALQASDEFDEMELRWLLGGRRIELRLDGEELSIFNYQRS